MRRIRNTILIVACAASFLLGHAWPAQAADPLPLMHSF